MRLVTYEPAPACERLGIELSGKVVDLALARDTYQQATHSQIPMVPSDMMEFLNQGASALKAVEELANWANEQLEKTGTINGTSGYCICYDLDSVLLRAPVPRPPKILCLALNYLDHASDVTRPIPEKPYIFIKPGIWPVVGPDDKVIRPSKSQNLVFEGELAVVIGERCHSVPRQKAYQVIIGYTIVNDMSARDLGKTNINQFDWFRVKAFDRSLPMGPCLTLKDEISDPHNLRLVVRVNNHIVQEASTGDMVFKIPEIIEFISEVVTLDPGDIIATGTPGGSKGALKAGDQVDVEIENIGTLRSIIADAEA